MQDVSGGKPVMVAGTDVPLWGLEIDTEEATQRFRASSSTPGSGKVCWAMRSSALAESLRSLWQLSLPAQVERYRSAPACQAVQPELLMLGV